MHAFSTNAQHFRFIHNNDKVGYTIESDSGVLIWQIEPIYDFLSFPKQPNLNNKIEIEEYIDNITWSDTSYILFYPDDKDPTLIMDSIVVSLTKKIDIHKKIIAKKNGKWGLLNANGTIALPFLCDSISIFQNKIGSSNGPLFKTVTNKNLYILNQNNDTILNNALLRKYYPELSYLALLNLLEIALYDNHLVIQKEGVFVDSIIHYPQSSYINYLNEKVIVDPINDESYFFKGGKYNIVSIKSGKPIFKSWHGNIKIILTSKINKFTRSFLITDKRLVDQLSSLKSEFFIGAKTPGIKFSPQK